MADNDLVRPGLCHHITKEIPYIKTKLLGKVTKASYRDVRRSKIPLYEAVLQELYEDNFPLTKNFLEQLIQKERHAFKNAEGLSKRKLSNFPELLDLLVAHLEEYEDLKDIVTPNDNTKVARKLFDFAKQLDTGIADLQWITEYILIIALDVQTNGDNLRAVILHYLGNFYARKKSYHLSVERYEEAKLLSTNQFWTFSDRNFSSLHSVICSELSDVMLCMAYDQFADCHVLSRELSEKALKYAEESKQSLSIGNAYGQFGELLLKFQFDEESKDMFMHALKHYRISANHKCICKTEINLAKSYLKLSAFDLSKKHVEKAIKIGSDNELTRQLAEAYATNGDIERKSGDTFAACDVYFKSVELYNSINDESKMRQVRCLAAVSLAQNVISPLISTILKSDKEKFDDNPYMNKLLKWADCREPFWEHESPEDCDDDDLDDIFDSLLNIDDNTKETGLKRRDEDQLKKIQQKRLSLSSDKILMYVNSSRESYSIFQRFREDAITKKTKVSNRSVFEK